MTPIDYNERSIEGWLGGDTLGRGRACIDAVVELRWGEGALEGKVQGTQPRPYEVRVRFQQAWGRLQLDARCNCPVGDGCKHVAALLLAGLDPRLQPTSHHGAPARPELARWIESFRTRLDVARADGKPTKSPFALAYLLTWFGHSGRAKLEIYKARVNKDGTLRELDSPWSNIEECLENPPKFVRREDLVILRALNRGTAYDMYDRLVLTGAHFGAVMPHVIATGRAFLGPADFPRRAPLPMALTAGPMRSARIEWHVQPDKRLRPVLLVEPPATRTVFTDPLWYLDEATGQAGPLDTPWICDQLVAFLAMPSIEPDEALVVETLLREVAPALPAPMGISYRKTRIVSERACGLWFSWLRPLRI